MLPKFRNAHYRTYGIRESAVEFAKRRAQRLLKESQITIPPILPEYLAPAQGIKKIIKEDLGNLSGLLLPLRDGFLIKINATHSPQRQNFSCAHEIAHTFFLEEQGRTLIKELTREEQKTSNKWIESLCDISASELLMPSQAFTRSASYYNFGIHSLEHLCRIFNTSVRPVALRLCDLNPRWCFLVHWSVDKSQDLDNYKLRATWLTWSRMKLTSTGSRFFFNPRLFVSSSSVLEAYRSETVTYLHDWIRVGNFKGSCQMWSKGFGSGSYRFVISLIFPECDN